MNILTGIGSEIANVLNKTAHEFYGFDPEEHVKPLTRPVEASNLQELAELLGARAQEAGTMASTWTDVLGSAGVRMTFTPNTNERGDILEVVRTEKGGRRLSLDICPYIYGEWNVSLSQQLGRWNKPEHALTLYGAPLSAVQTYAQTLVETPADTTVSWAMLKEKMLKDAQQLRLKTLQHKNGQPVTSPALI